MLGIPTSEVDMKPLGNKFCWRDTPTWRWQTLGWHRFHWLSWIGHDKSLQCKIISLNPVDLYNELDIKFVKNLHTCAMKCNKVVAAIIADGDIWCVPCHSTYSITNTRTNTKVQIYGHQKSSVYCYAQGANCFLRFQELFMFTWLVVCFAEK